SLVVRNFLRSSRRLAATSKCGATELPRATSTTEAEDDGCRNRFNRANTGRIVQRGFRQYARARSAHPANAFARNAETPTKARATLCIGGGMGIDLNRRTLIATRAESDSKAPRRIAMRAAVITGGMGGLGESISSKMHDAGYRVAVTHSPGNTKTKD